MHIPILNWVVIKEYIYIYPHTLYIYIYIYIYIYTSICIYIYVELVHFAILHKVTQHYNQLSI